MEKNELSLTKPIFDGELVAQIETIGKITSNIEEVKKHAISLQEYYGNIIFTEELKLLAKDEKAKITKYKNAVADYRKNIIKQFNEPIKQFEELAKETEKILSNTYDLINDQVISFENKEKEEKLQEIREYFEEYAKSQDVNISNFEDTGINITLSASMKSLKEKIKAFIDKIVQDLQVIETQEYKEEILYEYNRNNYDLSKAISTVLNRIEIIKRESEIKAQQKLEKDKIVKDINNFIEADTEFTAPVEEVIEVKELELLTSTFTVKGTLEQLKKLKKYIEDNGMEIIK